jgi:hypothetical protein
LGKTDERYTVELIGKAMLGNDPRQCFIKSRTRLDNSLRAIGGRNTADAEPLTPVAALIEGKGRIRCCECRAGQGIGPELAKRSEIRPATADTVEKDNQRMHLSVIHFQM